MEDRSGHTGRGGKSEHRWIAVVGNAHRPDAAISRCSGPGKCHRKYTACSLSKGEGKGEKVR